MPTSVLLVGESLEAFGLIGDCLRYNGFVPSFCHPRDQTPAGHHRACIVLCTSTESATRTIIDCRSDGHDAPVLALLAVGSNALPAALLNSGAMTTMALPVTPEHLIAQLHACLRRTGDATGGSYAVGPLTLHSGEQLVYLRGEPVALTAVEFRMLKLLMRRPGAIVSREALARCLPEPHERFQARSVSVHIHHLRSKLGASSIRTVRSLGYSVPADLASD